MEVLRTEGVKKHFGSVRAVDGVSIEVREGEIVSLVGPNGAGKTTLLNLISGLLKPDSGRVHFLGRDVTGMRPSQLVRMGMARCFQISNVFEDLTVLENLLAAVHSIEGKISPLRRYDEREAVDRAMAVLREFNLHDKAHLTPKELSHGDRKLLDVAIAYALNPKMILLDEPTAAMSVGEKRTTVRVIKKLRDQLGVTVLLVEHDLDVVYEVSDRIIVMHQGTVLAEGRPEEVREDPKVREVYLG